MEPDLNTMLSKLYGYPKPDTNPAIQQADIPKMSITQDDPTKKPRAMRTVGDVYTAGQAQAVFNPNVQPAVKPKNPPSNMVDEGTSNTLGTQGRWGTPNGQ